MIRFARSLTLAGFGLALLATPAPAQSPKAAKPEPQAMSQDDKAFLTYAAEDNQAEIALCLLAEKRAQAPAIKAFARLMVDDHTEIESRLAAVAEANKAALPDGVGKEGEETRKKLEPLAGHAFETGFMEAQIHDHTDDLKRFDHQAANTKNEALRQYAAETGPLLDQHLYLAKAVQASLKGE